MPYMPSLLSLHFFSLLGIIAGAETANARTESSMLLKLSKVAERLNCSVRNVHNLKDAGLLTVICTGANGKGYRVELSELERFMVQQRMVGHRPDRTRARKRHSR